MQRMCWHFQSRCAQLKYPWNAEDISLISPDTLFSLLLRSKPTHSTAKRKRRELICDHKYFTSKGKFINQASSLFATFFLSHFSEATNSLSRAIEKTRQILFLFHTLHNKEKIFHTPKKDYELFIKMGAKRNFLSSFLPFERRREWKNLYWCANHNRKTVSSRQHLNLHWQIFLLYLAVPILFSSTRTHRKLHEGKHRVATTELYGWRSCLWIHWRNGVKSFPFQRTHTRALRMRQESTKGKKNQLTE